MTPEQRLKSIAAVARKRFRLTVWQWAPGPVGTHANGSLHYQHFPDGVGRAFDAYGPRLRMSAFALWVKVRHGRYLTEGIYSGGPVILSRSHGRGVPGGFWGAATWNEHAGHVHVGI